MTGRGGVGEKDLAREPVPYFRYAFHNSYNYTLLGGVATAALLTGNLPLAVLGAGLEALWMVFGPDSRLLRRLWFDPAHAARLTAAREAERQRLLASLPSEDQARVAGLQRKRDEILRLCAENEAIRAELLKDELGKVEQLCASFIELVVSSRRYREYLETVDFDVLERDLREQTRRAEASGKGNRRPLPQGGERLEGLSELAQKNLAILMKRREKLAEIRDFVSQAEAQMALIENAFQLLTDQIVTMRSPKELSGQLDELMDGVEAVRSTARETEALLEAAR